MNDTHPRAARFYFETLGSMSPEERGRIVSSLSRGVRRLAEAGLRHQHPQASDEEIRARLAVRLYGRRAVESVLRVPDDAL